MKLVHAAALSAALLAGGLTSACGRGEQPPQSAEQEGEPRASDTPLFRGITLTDAQRARIDSLAVHYRSQMPAVDPNAPRDSAVRARRRELGEQQQAEIRALLTPDQQATFDRNLADLRQRAGGAAR